MAFDLYSLIGKKLNDPHCTINGVTAVGIIKSIRPWQAGKGNRYCTVILDNGVEYTFRTKYGKPYFYHSAEIIDI